MTSRLFVVIIFAVLSLAAPVDAEGRTAAQAPCAAELTIDNWRTDRNGLWYLLTTWELQLIEAEDPDALYAVSVDYEIEYTGIGIVGCPECEFDYTYSGSVRIAVGDYRGRSVREQTRDAVYHNYIEMRIDDVTFVSGRCRYYFPQ